MVEHEEKVNETTRKEQISATKPSKIDENFEDIDTQYANIQWKSLKKSLSNSEILAQAILFLFAGNLSFKLS